MVREAMSSLWQRVRRAVSSSHKRLEEENEEDTDGRASHSDEPNGGPSRSVSTDYTELMGGSVPCPSCKGTGRIPKEMEETLVALIPINDERLKPKHTWRWVVAVVFACVFIAGAIVFMLMPRAVELHSLRPSIDRVFIIEQSDPSKIQFHFMNSVNISNANYYAVEVTNTTATVISKFQPWSKDVIGSGMNTSEISISPLSGPFQRFSSSIAFNNSVTLTGYTAQYCQAPFSKLTSLYVNMEFDVVVTLTYFNHKEQISAIMVQQVCCVPSGNCTLNF